MFQALILVAQEANRIPGDARGLAAAIAAAVGSTIVVAPRLLLLLLGAGDPLDEFLERRQLLDLFRFRRGEGEGRNRRCFLM